jgi:tetratricopeptide (TPR) repeat protein
MAESGLSRSAQILAEMSLTFYTNGIAEMANTVHNPAATGLAPYKPSPVEAAAAHPTPAALAFFGRCCLLQGEHRRAAQYTKSALAELAKLRRAGQLPYDHPAQAQLGPLASPEFEWSLQLVDAHMQGRDEAQMQRLLEQLYLASLKPSPAPEIVAVPALPPKYLLLLARLYTMPVAPAQAQNQQQQSTTTSNPRAAIDIYTLLLQRHPLAVEAALELIKLNVDPRPIMSKSWAAHNTTGGLGVEPLLAQQSVLMHLFLTAHWNAHQHRYREALVEQQGGFSYLLSLAPRSTYMMEQRAWAQMQCTDGDPAMRSLAHLHAIDPYALNSMGLLAFLYHRRKHLHRELSTLMAHVMRIDDARSDSWAVAALDVDAKGNREKCAKYLDKAIALAAAAPSDFSRPLPSANVLALPLLLRGFHLCTVETQAFRELQSESLAAQSRGEDPLSYAGTKSLEQSFAMFRRTLAVAPNLLILQFALAQSYVLHAHIHVHQLLCNGQAASLQQAKSFQLAVALMQSFVANSAHQRNARVHAQLGLVLVQSPDERQAAAAALQRAHALDAEFADVSLALAEMYMASSQFQDALAMLRAYCERTAIQPHTSAANTPTAGLLLNQRDVFLVRQALVHADMARGEADPDAKDRHIAQAHSLCKQALTLNPQCTEASEAMGKIEMEDDEGQQPRYSPTAACSHFIWFVFHAG